MPFSEIARQERAVAALRAALRRDALHHAYLFGGPEGAGKATAARLLAQAANCERGGDDPCGECLPCRKIARGIHPDVHVLHEERRMVKAGTWEPRGGRAPSKDVVVDQVRDLVDRRLSLTRVEGKRRFVVVDPADAMNVQAQNALLKTLEEPPDATTIVLVAANPDALLPTIRSRCVRVAFAPDDAAAIAALRERARPAKDGTGVVEGALALDPQNAATWVAFAREQGDDRERARARLELLLVWLRDVLAAQAAGQASQAAPLALPDLADATRRAAADLSAGALLRRRAFVEDAIAAIRGNAAAPLALERMLVGWFHG